MFPEGIGAEQRIELVETYSQTLADRYNVLVDVSIHRPHSYAQHKDNGEVAELTTNNFHAHILLSSREILADGEHGYGLSARKNWSQWSTSERLSKGLKGLNCCCKNTFKTPLANALRIPTLSTCSVQLI